MSYDSTILAETALVLYWKLDEASGTSAADSKGASTGTYTGGCTLGQAGAGPGTGTSVLLNGISGWVSGPLPLATASSWSLECWFNTNAITTANQAIIYNGSGDTNGYGIVLNGNGTTAGNLYYLRGGLFWQNTSVTVLANTWYHVCLTNDASNNANLYLNGVLKWSGGGTPNAPTVGLGVGNDRTSPASWFHGLVDAAAIYNTALSGAAVLNHYNAGLATPSDTGTGAATLGRVTASGSGTVTDPGSGAAALGRVTASGSGTVTDTGSGSVTLAPVTAAGSGTVTVTTDAGSGADTPGRVTATGSGSVTDAGSGASTLAPVTASGAGAVTGDQALGSFWECLFAWYARDAGARAACPGGLVNAEAAPDQVIPYARVWELEDQEPESQDDREVEAAVSFYEADDNAGTSGDAGARAAGSAFSARLLDPLARGEWRFFDGPDVWRESGVLWIPPGKLTVAGKAAGGRRVWRYDLWFKFFLTRPG